MKKYKVNIDRRLLAYNSNGSKIKRFSNNKQNKDKFFEYLFIAPVRTLSALGKEQPLIKTREKLKVYRARDEWKN